jgi:uncharacterized protein YhaN
MAVIDQGTASVIGAVLVLAGTIYTVSRADRKGRQAAEHAREAETEQAATSFHDNLALTQYIREQVRLETEELRTELGDVKRILGNVYGRLDRIREAVREYIRQVRVQWGRSEEPPPVDGHLAELLGDVDEDTWTSAKVAELTAQREGVAEHDEPRAAAQD